MASLDSPGGGGDGSGDDHELDGNTDGESGGNTDGGGGVSAALGAIANRNLRAFLLVFMGVSTVNMLVGEDGKSGLLNNPKEFILDVVMNWMFNSFLKPIAESIWNGGSAVIDALLLVFFGGNYKIGHPGETSVGILDLPFLITKPLGLSYQTIGESISSAITAINSPIVEAVSTLGIAAPIVAPVLIVIELAAAAWLLWLTISLIDIPAIRGVATVKAALRPLTNFIGWLLE